jgi:hypothetical protein
MRCKNLYGMVNKCPRRSDHGLTCKNPEKGNPQSKVMRPDVVVRLWKGDDPEGPQVVCDFHFFVSSSGMSTGAVYLGEKAASSCCWCRKRFTTLLYLISDEVNIVTTSHFSLIILSTTVLLT